MKWKRNLNELFRERIWIILKKPLIILTGPTAVGKTDLSIKLAKAVNGEIISADSMQVYKKMDIGTAKIMPEEMDGIPHYLIDVLDPKEDFHVVLFQKLAKEAIEEIYAKGKVPIITGGTGFYIQALLYDISFDNNDGDMAYREELEELAKEKGAEYLHNMLAEIDEEAAKSIHANNIKRVIRAIEFHKQTGRKISEHNEEERQKVSPYNFVYFVLNNDRQVLYERIEKRVDIMLEQGLVAEVEALYKEGYDSNLVSMLGLGYKEILAYLKGECTLEEAVYILKRDTRHFAKRQLTWFKREKEITWVNKNEFTSEEEILPFMIEQLKEKGVI